MLKFLKKLFFLLFASFYFNLFFMINYSFSSGLKFNTEKLSGNEKQIIISGFQRAYGVGIFNGKIYIPDFMTGLVYEIDLENKKNKILTRKNNKLKYLTTIEKLIKKKQNSIIQPHDIYIDDRSNFYISEMGPGRKKGKGKISVFDKNFNLIKEIGPEVHNNYGLIAPVMIYEESEIFYVSEYGSNKILRFNKNFEYMDWIGEFDEITKEIKNNSWELSKQFININLIKPHAVKTGPNGNIYIVDTGNNRILRYGQSGEFKGWIGKNKNGEINNSWSKEGISVSGDEPGAFDAPLDLVIKGNFMYISEVQNHRINKIGLDGRSYGWIGISKNNNFEWTKNNKNKLDLKEPYGIKIKDNIIFIADRRNDRIKIVYSKNLF